LSRIQSMTASMFKKSLQQAMRKSLEQAVMHPYKGKLLLGEQLCFTYCSVK
jgi:hypothetical protein